MDGAVAERVVERRVDELVLLDERQPVEARALDGDVEVVATACPVDDAEVVGVGEGPLEQRSQPLCHHEVMLLAEDPRPRRLGERRHDELVDVHVRRAGAPVTAVDILPDPRIRQELSALSGWPTIPQVFVRGELIGGADIVQELEETGELERKLEEALGPEYPESRAEKTVAL